MKCLGDRRSVRESVPQVNAILPLHQIRIDQSSVVDHIVTMAIARFFMEASECES